MDRAVRSLFDAAAGERVALAAIGGYAGHDLTPGSDVDLLFVHEPGSKGHTGAATVVDAVLYPLWDAGIRVSHAVRTPDGCGDEAAERFDSLTSMLGARRLAGADDLVAAARDAARSVVRRDEAAFVAGLRAHREARRERFGAIDERLEPDLKEALGGVRDWQLVRWAAVTLVPSDGSEGSNAYEGWFASVAAALSFDQDGSAGAAEACGRLLGVRLALHVANGGASNALTAEHHEALAGILRPAPREGWEPRDALMRQVAADGRTVDRFVDHLMRELEPGVRTRPTPPGPASRPVDALERWTAAVRACEEWSDVLGRPQRDPYHRFPVDVHLERTAAEVARLLHEPGDDFTTEAVHVVGDPEALLIAALLHDIGKVGRGGHAALGGDIAARVMARIGVAGGRREHVAFLVREHLLLSDTATRRNIDDEDLVVHVSARIRDPERLAMLYLLTVADAAATGPAASTPWRLGLIRDLVARVSRAFDRGLMNAGRADRLERAERRLRRALAGADVEAARAEGFLRTVPAAYVLWVRAADVPHHVNLVLPPPAEHEARSHVAPGRAAGTYLLAVGARDRLGLLASIAGALSVSGLSILTARAFTTADGVALDTFDVRGAFEPDVDEARWERFVRLLSAGLDGSVDLAARVHTWRSHYRPPTATVPVRVAVDQDASDFFTLVEVTAADRLGLLFDLAQAFAASRIDVHLAKVATYGPRVVDVFYVTQQTGGKVIDPLLLERLRSALVAAASLIE